MAQQDKVNDETMHALGYRRMTTEMSMGEIATAAKPLLELLNEMQTESGMTVNQVLMVLAATLGFTLHQRGALIDLDAPVRQAIPPIAWGYETAAQARLNG
jgi:hypothetical protein